LHRTNTLKKILKSIQRKSFKGKLYRTVQAEALYKFSTKGPYTPRPLYNIGSGRGGARYTPIKGVPSIYFSEDLETSMREVLRIASPKPIMPAAHYNFSALVTYEVEVNLKSVLDLTQGTIRKKLGTSLKELAEPWRIRRDRLKPPTQRLGAVAATSERFQGILFNSTMKSGNCMVIFTDKIIAPYFIQINDPEGNLIGQLP